MSPLDWLVRVTLIALALPLSGITGYKRNYDSRYTNSDIPEWKQRACEKAQKNRANSHYICDDKGDVKCLSGWQGDLCQVPMCRKGCDPMNGYCQRPGECRCRIGYTGEMCDKCIPLPGCQHGYCTKPFECICKPGWDGLFCTEPTCRQGCHSTRGYCEAPGECRCRIGWAGRNCSDCSVLPGCQHGTCSKPLECQCLPGYTGLLCQTAFCSTDCHKQHGYCRKPGECRCKVGWTGENCDKCFPYPGCVNGTCQQPWECNCNPGWGGMLCDEELTYCEEHPSLCENNGKCVSLTKADGSYRCHCKQGYLGKNCEIVDEFMLTSTTAPRITPPPLPSTSSEEQYTTAKPKIDIAEVTKSTESENKADNEDEDNEDDDDDEEEEEYDDDEEDEEDVGEPENISLVNQTTTEIPTRLVLVNSTTIKDKRPSNDTNEAVKANNITTTTSKPIASTKLTKITTKKPTRKTNSKSGEADEALNKIPVDDEGFARRRNGGGSSFIFPTMLTETDVQGNSGETHIDLEALTNTAPDIIGTATGR